jgi:hypothetical protein
MPTSNRLVFPHLSRNKSVTSRTAVYGPVRTVVWQGSAGDRRPYADQVALTELLRRGSLVCRQLFVASQFRSTLIVTQRLRISK